MEQNDEGNPLGGFNNNQLIIMRPRPQFNVIRSRTMAAPRFSQVSADSSSSSFGGMLVARDMENNAPVNIGDLELSHLENAFEEQDQNPDLVRQQSEILD